MSKNKPPKKKVVATGSKPKTKKTVSTRPKTTGSGTTARRRTIAEPTRKALVIGRQNYILMGAGAALIILGLVLMSGGEMPSADVWEDDIIYSSRRTAIAPLVILAGLVLEVYAIFKRA